MQNRLPLRLVFFGFGISLSVPHIDAPARGLTTGTPAILLAVFAHPRLFLIALKAEHGSTVQRFPGVIAVIFFRHAHLSKLFPRNPRVSARLRKSLRFLGFYGNGVLGNLYTLVFQISNGSDHRSFRLGIRREIESQSSREAVCIASRRKAMRSEHFAESPFSSRLSCSARRVASIFFHP